MDNPQVIKKKDDLRWLGGFFDGEGYCSFSPGSPTIGLDNTIVDAIYKCVKIFSDYGVEAKINIRKKTPKTKKRWDLFINQADHAIRAAEVLLPYVFGKRKQLLLMLEYANHRKNAQDFHKRMRYLNQTNNILIKDDEILWKKLGFIYDKQHENINDQTQLVITDNFDDLHYLAGVIDAEGCINMHRRHGKCRERFTPQILINNTNKKIISKTVSAIQKMNIGCYVNFRVFQNRNRGRWDVISSGVKRVKTFSQKILEFTFIKKEQLKMINLYCEERLLSPKSLNSSGQNYKSAIEALRN